MEKVMRIGKIKDGNVFIKAEFNDGKFSMSGVIGPMRNGNARGGCGQISMEFEHRNPENNDDRYQKLITPKEIVFAKGWDREKWLDLLDIWEKWHLNDMQAGCEHQRENWNVKEKIELTEFTWSNKFHELRTKATEGKLSPAEYEGFKSISAEVLQVTIKSPVKWKSPLAEKLLEDDWIKEKNSRDVKATGWVYENEHPKGLLMKACPDCGYQYGSKWLKKDVPESVILRVLLFPDTDISPAWI